MDMLRYMRAGQTWRIAGLLLALLGHAGLFAQPQAPPSRKYPLHFLDADGEEYYLEMAWMKPLPDGGFLGRVWDAAWVYHFNAELEPVSAWRLGAGVTYSGIPQNGNILHFSFDIDQAALGVSGAVRAAAVVQTTPDGAILEQHALLFQDSYDPETLGDLGNNRSDANDQGESFLLLESGWEVPNILKLDPAGQALWQVRLSEGTLVDDGPMADAHGGCWLSLRMGAGREILRLDSLGNVVFWNRYDRPGSLDFAWGSSLFDNGTMGLTVCGLDSARLFWMNIDPAGQVTSYRLYPSITYPTYTNYGHPMVSMGWTGGNWAMAVGGTPYAHEQVLFCTIDGTPERAYAFPAPMQSGDTIYSWNGSVEYTRRPKALLVGLLSKRDTAGHAFEPNVTITVLPAGPWQHCMVQQLPVPGHVMLPPGDIIVTPVAGVVAHPPLPQVLPLALATHAISLFPYGPLCEGPLHTEEVREVPDLWLERTVVDRGTPIRFQARKGGHGALLDPTGRLVAPWMKVSAGVGSMSTDQLVPGIYMLVFRADGQAVRTARVVVQ